MGGISLLRSHKCTMQSAPSEPARQNASRAQRTAEAKTALMAALTASSAQIDSELQERAKNIHANEKALSNQERDIHKETKKLAKQNDALEKFVTKSTKQLAVFDELEPLQADVEDDLADLEALLDELERNPSPSPNPESHTS